MANSPVSRSRSVSSYKFLLFPAVVLTGVALLAGCKPAAVAVTDPNDPKFVVAEKGSWQITEGELDTQVGNFLKQHQATAEQVGPAKMPIVKTMMLKNLVLKKLLLDKAAAMQLKDVDKEEAAELDTIKQQIPPGQDLDTSLKAAGLTLDDLKKQIHEKVLISKVLEAEAYKNVDPTDAEITDIYTKNQQSFTIPEKRRASRVLIHVDETTSAADKAADKKLIDKAHDRVAKGEDFGKVATEVSQDRSSAPKGGDLGYFARGENPDAGFDDVAFGTKENALSPVFLTPLGYQFIKITAIQPAGPVPLAEARGYISSKLKERKMEEQSQDYAKKLLADSGVTYHFVLVDPPAQNPAGPEAAQDEQSAQAPASAPDASAPSTPPAAPDASSAPAPAAPAPAAAPATPNK
jgi:parvulin-like peptidyl-prolyl isomerase